MFILELTDIYTLSLEYHECSLPWNRLVSIHAWVTLPLLSAATQSTVLPVWKCHWIVNSASFLWSERSRVGLPMLSFRLLQVDFYHQSGSSISVLHCSHSNLRGDKEKKRLETDILWKLRFFPFAWYHLPHQRKPNSRGLPIQPWLLNGKAANKL